MADVVPANLLLFLLPCIGSTAHGADLNLQAAAQGSRMPEPKDAACPVRTGVGLFPSHSWSPSQ